MLDCDWSSDVCSSDLPMKSPMLPEEHHAAVQRALALGRGGDPATLPELNRFGYEIGD
jgi:hypothetical protein